MRTCVYTCVCVLCVFTYNYMLFSCGCSVYIRLCFYGCVYLCHAYTWAWTHIRTHTNSYIPIQTYMHTLHMHIYSTASIHTHMCTRYMRIIRLCTCCVVYMCHILYALKFNGILKLISGFSADASQYAGISSSM